jgi:hypothetical protein
VTVSEGKAGPIDGGELSTLLVEKIEGTTETEVEDRVPSLSLTGRRDEAELPWDADDGVGGPPCSELGLDLKHRLSDVLM